MTVKLAVNKHRTSPDTLDAVYHSWYTHNAQITQYYNKWHRSYQKTYRLDGVNQLFEHWVAEQGGKILQENRKRFIEFADEGLLFQFVLTWT